MRGLVSLSFGKWFSVATNFADNSKLFDKLQEIFTKYANNSSKFSVVASSQGNKIFNNIMALEAPKNRYLSESADYRLASAMCTKNDSESHLLNIESKFCILLVKET